EITGIFGYGEKLPKAVRIVLTEYSAAEAEKRSLRTKVALVIQAATAVILVLGLAFHIAAVGLVGLMVIILLTAFNGVIEEHRIGHAFEEALPFTALLVVFFSVVSVIHDQHLFTPVITWVLSLDQHVQPIMFFAANGLLS